MLAITSHNFPREAEDTLTKFGHRTLRLPPHPNLPKPVASHPDMLLFFSPNAIFCTKSYYEIATLEVNEISDPFSGCLNVMLRAWRCRRLGMQSVSDIEYPPYRRSPTIGRLSPRACAEWTLSWCVRPVTG